MLKISFSRALCLKRHRTQSSHSSSQPTSHPVTFGIQMISHHLVIASRLLLLVVQKALMEHQSAYERSFANYCNLCIAARCSKFCQPVELIEKFIKQNSIFLEFGELQRIFLIFQKILFQNLHVQEKITHKNQKNADRNAQDILESIKDSLIQIRLKEITQTEDKWSAQGYLNHRVIYLIGYTIRIYTSS